MTKEISLSSIFLKLCFQSTLSRYFLLFALFYTPTMKTEAQQTNIHSIENTSFKMETTVVNQTRNNTIDSLTQLLKSNNSSENPPLTLISLGDNLQQVGNFELADSIYRKALDQFPSNKEILLAELYTKQAMNFSQWGEFESALIAYQNAYSLFQQNHSKINASKVIHQMSFVAEKQGNYPEAIGYLHQAKLMYEGIGYIAGMAKLAYDLGTLLQKWGKYPVAIQYYRDALSYFKRKNLAEETSLIYLNLGQIAQRQNNYTQALVYLDSALIEQNITSKNEIEGFALLLQGDIYFNKKQYTNALKFYYKANDVFKDHISNEKHIETLQKTGRTLLKQKNYQEATAIVERSLMLAKKNDHKVLLMLGWDLRAQIYAAESQFEKAYHCVIQHNQLHEEIFSEGGHSMTNEIALKYETDRIAEAYSQLIRQNKQTTTALEDLKETGTLTIILATFIILVSLIIIIFVITRTRESRKGYAILAVKNKKISDQKEILANLNEQLTQSREQYRSMVENASIGMYQTNKDGSIKFINNALKQMLRYPEHFHSSEINLFDMCENRMEFTQILEEKKKILGREDIWKRLDGSYMEISENAWISVNNKNNEKNFEGLVQDISKRKEVERALVESQNQLKKTNQDLIEKNRLVEKAKNEAINANESKSVFLANVSHEIRTPLNSIIGFSEILLSESKDPNQLYYLNIIKTSGSNLLALLNDILDFSKIQSNKIELIYEPVSLDKIVEDALNIVSVTIKKKNLSIKINKNEPFPEIISIDGVRIRQVVINLLSNAVKFTEKGSIQLNYSFENNRRDQSGTLKIEVRDTGIGIAKEEIDCIFDAFKQSRFLGDKAYSGTGLGLTISKNLTEAMGGSIQIESQINQGTSFKVVIPNIKICPKIPHTSPSKYNQYTNANNHLTEQVKISLRHNGTEQSQVFPQWLKSKVNNELQKDWMNVVSCHMFTEINQFTNKLIEIADQEDYTPLQKIGNELHIACCHFDVDKIEELMLQINTFFPNNPK